MVRAFLVERICALPPRVSLTRARIRRYGEPNSPIPRKVITRGIARETTLELFPVRLFAHVVTPDNVGGLTPSTPAEVVVSSMDKISDVRKKLFEAVFPDSENADFRIWRLGERPSSSRYISLSEFNQKDTTDELEESERKVEESPVEDQDAFAVEVRRDDGQWLVQDTADSQAAPTSSQQTQPAEDEPKPLFHSGSDFFSQMQAKKPQTISTLKSALAVAAPTKDPRPVPKVSTITPGTLGLGNMSVYLHSPEYPGTDM